jgi:hypothetical protein
MGLIIKPGYWHPFDTHVITHWEKGVGNTKSTCHTTYLPTSLPPYLPPYLPTSLPTYHMQHETHPKDKAIFFIYLFMAFVTFFYLFFPSTFCIGRNLSLWKVCTRGFSLQKPFFLDFRKKKKSICIYII